MDVGATTAAELTRQFFAVYPDYVLCRTLVANIQEGVTTHRQALGHLSSKAWAEVKNEEAIREKLNARSIDLNGQRIALKSLSIRRILDQSDQALEEILRFYLKHPYAHHRTFRSRWLPSWVRGFFLRVLIGNAKARGLKLNYAECFDLLTML